MIIENYLLEIGAIKTSSNEPFTWSSGIKSPVYCDIRVVLSYPHVRSEIVKSLSEKIMKEYPEVEYIAGVATAGIPWASLVANQLEIPMIYVRGENKSHGLQNKIEGHITKGSKVVAIEDTVSTGGSLLNAVNSLKSYDLEVLGCASIYTYGFQKTIEKFREMSLKLVSLVSYLNLRELNSDLPDFQI